jgi:hypothetical protein
MTTAIHNKAARLDGSSRATRLRHFLLAAPETITGDPFGSPDRQSGTPAVIQFFLSILIAFLFRRCADIDIDFLVAADEPAAKHQQRRYHNDHKNHQHRYDPSTTASAIVSHDFSPLKVFESF